MVKEMKFYNRERELKELERIYALCNKGTHLTVISGRRRIGKTTLVEEFGKDKKMLSFFVSKKRMKLLLEEYGNIIEDFFKQPVSFSEFSDFLEFIFKKAQTDKKKFILFFDEFQNFHEVDSSVFSIFQQLLDKYKKGTKLHIIIAGSYMTMIKKLFSDKKEPLYGRANEKLRIYELEFQYVRKMLNETGIKKIEEQVEYYSLFGGVPKYYVMLQEQNIREAVLKSNKILFLSDFALLKNEVRNMLFLEFGSKTGVYFSILEAVATGKSEMVDIANKVGINVHSLPKYLKLLSDHYKILEKEIPITEEKTWKSKKGIYLIKDPLARFWFRFIYRNNSYYQLRNYEYIENIIKQNLNSFVGLAFERLCREYTAKLIREKRIQYFEKIGRWWNKRGLEIDVVAINKKSKEIMFGECKWTNKKFDVSDLELLLKKKENVNWNLGNRKEYFIIFSKSGFTDKMKETAKKEGIKLINLEDLKG